MPNTQPFMPRQMPKELEGLVELSLDLRWTGSQATDAVWELLDPEIWERTKNPYLVLEEATDARLEQAAKDPKILEAMRAAVECREKQMADGAWFHRRYPQAPFDAVGYFSMEFGLSESLPIYAGGLGILAGDHMKTASDMGVPVFGVGLLYDQGYFQQVLNAEGWQIEANPYNDPVTLPVTPVQSSEGGWMRVSVDLPGRTLLLRIWSVKVGHATVYLLDSNDPLNLPWDRAITATLYQGEQERRLLQEIVLGIGGWMALQKLGVKVDVCHMNEGHAAFAVLARARDEMHRVNCDFYQALMATRAGNVFTTHTPVPAGFDRFDSGLVERFLEPFAGSVGLPIEELLNLGRERPGIATDSFNMAWLAARSSGHINGVSRLHGKVSQSIFGPIYPHWPVSDVPVGYVTNGVHVASWDSEEAEVLWNRTGKDPSAGSTGEPVDLGPDVISDDDLWSYRRVAKRKLVRYVRRRLERQLRSQLIDGRLAEDARNILDEDALTIGFARRFAAYKRPNLFLHDPDRLCRILLSSERPVQVIVAGKAHPGDFEGKKIVQQVVEMAAHSPMRTKIVFLTDYDIALTQALVAGVDVWLNTPRRPMEASGTSGMKILVNGGINLSELDGWWAEAYDPSVGWALGDGWEHSEPDWDEHEANQLYELLEQQVVPEFYERDAEGIPVRWLQRVRASMGRLTPAFSSERMLRQYVENFYAPAAAECRKRTQDGSKLAADLRAWQKRVDDNWRGVGFGEIETSLKGDQWCYTIHVWTGGLAVRDLAVEIFAEVPGTDEPLVVRATTAAEPMSHGMVAFCASVPANRPIGDYTPRIWPYHPEAIQPGESTHIIWAK